MSDIKEKMSKLQELREEAKSFANVNFSDMDGEQKEEWAKRNDDMESLSADIRAQQTFEKQKADNESAIETGQEVKTLPIHGEEKITRKSLADMVLESKAFQSYKNDGMLNVKSEIAWNPLMEQKTLLNESGYPPAVIRDDLIVPTATRNPNAVIDLFSVINTQQYQYKYLEETTFTNNAAEAAEGAAYAESAVAFTERTEEIRKFGVSIPVTEELLADVATVQGYLDSRLRTMLQLRLDDVLIGGSGTAPVIRGILNKTGINSFNFANYSGNLGRIGQIYEAITEIRKDAFMEADAILMHPSDWHDIVTQVNQTAGTSGAGFTETSPTFLGAGMFGGSVTPTLWGVKVVPTTATSAGTVIVGVFGGGLAAHIVSREGMEVSMSDSHDDFFTKDKVMMKANMRLGFPIYRAAAFAKITNM